MTRVLCPLAFSLLIAGCTIAPPSPPLSGDHPAKADAPTTPLPQVIDLQAGLLPATHESDPFTTTAPAEAEPVDHSGHQMPSSEKSTTTPTDDHTGTYVCPMHAEVAALEPGKCPKCKMKLVKKGGR
jgi:hypothetical protein